MTQIGIFISSYTFIHSDVLYFTITAPENHSLQLNVDNIDIVILMHNISYF